MMQAQDYNGYRNWMQQVADFRYSAAVLQWDQETYMPVKGEAARARQIATLSETAHGRFTDEAFGDQLRKLSGDNGISASQMRNVVLSLEDFERDRKLPSDFVRRLSETVSQAFQAWIAARRANDFRVLAPVLDNVIRLKREEADRKGYTAHPYNALLRDYEKSSTVERLDGLFNAFIPPLRALMEKIRQAPQVDNSFLKGSFPRQAQWEWGMELLKKMGMDFSAARQDISEHPFTTNFAATDVRVTTRISESDFSSMTWSCIHEGGHALYEQGLPAEEYGLPLGEACSLSIHESQSRLWENNLGRSLPFWEGLWKSLLASFPGAFDAIDPPAFHKAINRVEPSLVRTEADELTYHFHILIRYELEKALIEGSLSILDVPAYWREAYQKYLGISVPDDLHGCLQDVHWSHGSFGYFPTYTLGSLYAAQLYNTCKKQLPGLEAGVREGNYRPVLDWLRDAVHRHGRYFETDDLCREATGSGLDPRIFLAYAEEKYRMIYDLR